MKDMISGNLNGVMFRFDRFAEVNQSRGTRPGNKRR